MNFYSNHSYYEDAYVTPAETFEGKLALRYNNNSSAMSICNFLRGYASNNPEIVHYLQLHYPEYLL